MRATVLSDAHLQARDGRQAELVAFLRRCETDELVLGGDVFDAWWGWDHAVFAAYLPFLGALEELLARGVRVTWVPGNHDFRAGGFITGELGVPEVEVWQRDGVAVMHGDQFDRPPLQRLFNRFMHGRAAQLGARIAGPDRAWRAGLALATRNRDRGHDDGRHQALLARQHAWADGVARDLGVEVLCLGHTHAPGELQLSTARLVNLGDWLHHFTYAVVEDGAVRLMRWRAGRATPVPPGAPRRWPWADEVS